MVTYGKMELSKAIQKVNEYTKKNSGFFDFAEPYGLFQKLKVEAKLQLRDIQYYQGQRLPSHEYLPKIRQKQDELEPNTELESLFGDRRCRHICFVGPAGIGKTTLTRSIARGALEGIYSGLSNGLAILFLHCRDYKPGDLVSAEEYLFGETDLTKNEIEGIFKLTQKYPEKVLFILDSLDTLQYKVDGVYKFIHFHEKACPEAILWNFLSGNLFPGCQIITSSREYTIHNYKGEVRPSKVITILGLTKKSMLEVVIGYVGEPEAKEFMHYLETKAPSLQLLCTTPVNLVYSLIGYKADSDFTPTTSTGCLIVVLQSIIRSQHTHHEDILGVMHKLEELSYNGMQDGRVLFTYDDLHQVGLKPQDATDLTIFAPGGFKEKLLQGESRLFFSHQTLQEVFCALWISKMSQVDFEEFFKSLLKTPHYVAVRKFLFGILFDCEVNRILSKDLLQGDVDLQAKIKIMREDLQSQLERGNLDSDLLELSISLSEAKDGISDIIKSSLYQIWLDSLSLSLSDVFAIGSIISQCDQFDVLWIKNCSLDASSLNLLRSQLKESTVKLRQFNFDGIENMGIDGISAIGGIVTENDVEVLHLSSCRLPVEQLQTLADSTKNATKLRRLLLDCIEDMGIDGISAIGGIVTQTGVEILHLSSCRLSAKQLQTLADSTKNATKLRKFVLDCNENMGIDGISAIGEIVTQNDVEVLHLSRCRLSAKQLHTLVTSTKNATKLRKFVLDCNENMGIDGISAIGGIVTGNDVEKLHLCDCRLSAEQLQTLADSTKNATKLRCLSLHQNETMEISGISAIGRIVTWNDVEKLDLSECHLSAEQLQILADSTKDATKLQEVDLSNYSDMKHKAIQAVGNLLSNVTTKVKLCGYLISHEDVAYLRNKLVELGKEGLRVKIGRSVDDIYLSAHSQVEVTSDVLYPDVPSVTQTKGRDLKAVLPEVEEAIARQDGQSIIMTWKQFPIDRVSYWIQVYCNEEHTREPFPTRDFKFKIIDPKPGSRYTFIVWAERDGVQSKHRTLSRNFIMVHLAGEESSEMVMNGCTVKFRQGTFEKVIKVWMSVESSCSTCLEEYFPITPVMDIDSESPLHENATVEMKSCCVNLDKSEVDILHSVYCENADHMEWISIAPQSCTKDGVSGVIEFQCKDFSPWRAIKRKLTGTEEFTMNIHLYVKDDQFFFLIFKNDDNVVKKIEVAMDRFGACLAQMYKQCVVTVGDKITIEPWVDGKPKSPKFIRHDDDYVVINKTMLKKDYEDVVFQLKETAVLSEGRSVCIRCNINSNVGKVDIGKELTYPLNLPQSVPKPVLQIHPLQLTTNISTTGLSVAGGNTLLHDCGINVQATSSCEGPKYEDTQSAASTEPKEEIEEATDKS